MPSSHRVRKWWTSVVYEDSDSLSHMGIILLSKLILRLLSSAFVPFDLLLNDKNTSQITANQRRWKRRTRAGMQQRGSALLRTFKWSCFDCFRIPRLPRETRAERIWMERVKRGNKYRMNRRTAASSSSWSIGRIWGRSGEKLEAVGANSFFDFAGRRGRGQNEWEIKKSKYKRMQHRTTNLQRRRRRETSRKKAGQQIYLFIMSDEFVAKWTKLERGFAMKSMKMRIIGMSNDEKRTFWEVYSFHDLLPTL